MNKEMEIKINIKDKGALLANADVVIQTQGYGAITIKGFQIWKSECFNRRLKKYINIMPPSRRWYGKYIKIVFFEDPLRWEKLEKEIFIEYTNNEPISIPDLESENTQ